MIKNKENLYKAILKLKNTDEASRFFRDLLTEKEIIGFSKRWAVAQMLFDEIPYSKIEKKTGLSSTTIARISKWLNRGRSGYKLIIKRAHHSSNSLKRGLN